MERAIMRIVRRILDIGFSNPSAVFSSPPPDGANKPRRSTSPHQRATTSSGTKNRPDSLPPSNNSGTSALDLEPNSSADVDAAASSTGRTARRRRQRQRAASNTNPGQERPEDLDEGKATAFDSKNSASEQQSSVELDEDKPTVSNPKSATSDQECFAELDIDAKNRQDKLAAKKRRHSQNRRERKRGAVDAKNGAMSEEISAELDTAKAKATATDPKPLHLEHQNASIVLRDHAPLDAPPIGDHRDGLHGAALTVAATSPPAAVPPRRPARTRAPAYVPDDRPFAAAATAAGLLDDIQGEKSFFYKMFDEPDDDDEYRARHRQYLEACSSLKKNLIYCLACFLSDDKTKHPPIANVLQEVNKHMSSAHKGGWKRCTKRGCYAMATNLKDITNHEYYAHQI